MKKLIMFLMVLAISVPVSATINDTAPPMWGTAGTTGVWHFVDPSWSEPTCLEGTEYYHFDVPDATWAYGVLTTSSTAFETLWGGIGLPAGGTHVTIHVQIAASEEIEDAGQASLEICRQASEPGGEDSGFLKEIYENDEADYLVNAGGGVYTLTGTMLKPAGANLAAGCYIGANQLQLEGIIIDVITHDGETPPTGPARILDCPVPVPAILVDPNVMVVYEEGETEGDFTVSLINEPPTGATITITVDPNGGGPSEDITLIGGSGVTGSITMTFTDETATDTNSLDLAIASCDDWNPATKTSCWNAPITITFKAIDDDIPEPPNLEEPQNILVSSSWPGHETDANFVSEKYVKVVVVDNDQANILFTVTPAEKNTPRNPVMPGTSVQIWEQPRIDKYGYEYDLWRKIGVTLQVAPMIDGDPCKPTTVKLQAVVTGGSGNPPPTDPNLLPGTDNPHFILPFVEADDPNGFTFTSTTSTGETGLPGDCPDWSPATKTSCWDVGQPIMIWANDDAVLQALDAVADGDEDYHATLVVIVIDSGGDERYEDDGEMVEGVCVDCLERKVEFDIEDNECGAFGILELDVSNPYYVTDANYVEDDPDCYVDIYDVIWMASGWINCSDPQDPDCTKYND